MTQEEFIGILEKGLQKMVREEDYEMAARLRDLLKYEQMEDGEAKKAYKDQLIETYGKPTHHDPNPSKQSRRKK